MQHASVALLDYVNDYYYLTFAIRWLRLFHWKKVYERFSQNDGIYLAKPFICRTAEFIIFYFPMGRSHCDVGM